MELSLKRYESRVPIYPLLRVFYSPNLWGLNAIYPQNLHNFLYRPIHRGYKTKKIKPVYPQIQNSVGTLERMKLGMVAGYVSYSMFNLYRNELEIALNRLNLFFFLS